MLNALDLTGHAALVTGSSQGIGAAIAGALEAQGARVVRHGHLPRPDGVPPDELYLQADLSEPEAAERLASEAFAAEPALDILVSNAGGFFDVPFLEMTPYLWARTMDLNLRSAYFLIQAFARRLTAEGRPGSVVVTASTNGLQAERDSSAYDISKGALIMLTRTLALALAGSAIRVNAIAPGLIRTPLTAGWLDTDQPLREHYEWSIPQGRIGSPQDCAGAAAFLASPAAAYITGQMIVIDGGLTIEQIRPPSTP